MSYLLGITEPSASPANRGGLAILAAARSASESVSSCTWPSKQERLKLFNSLDDKQQRQLKDQLAVQRREGWERGCCRQGPEDWPRLGEEMKKLNANDPKKLAELVRIVKLPPDEGEKAHLR
jgi:hypothetical protein